MSIRRPSFRVRPVALQGELEEVRYRKRDDGEYYRHTSDGAADLWLVEANGRRGTLTLPRGGRAGWTRDRGTYWLTNPPMSTRKRSSSTRRGTTRRKTRRPPPKGFASWSSYMASIRPHSKRRGGTMAKRKRRSRHARRARRNPAVAVYRSNPRTRRRRRFRSNPPFSVNGVVGRITDAGKGALFMVGGEGGTRFIRRDVLHMADGETMSSVADAAVGIALGIAAEKVVGRQAARDVTAGAFAYILRTLAKQLGIAKVNEILGDSNGGGRRYVVRGGRMVPLSGYPGRGDGRLAGYPGRGNGTSQAMVDEAAMGLR